MNPRISISKTYLLLMHCISATFSYLHVNISNLNVRGFEMKISITENQMWFLKLPDASTSTRIGLILKTLFK